VWNQTTYLQNIDPYHTNVLFNIMDYDGMIIPADFMGQFLIPGTDLVQVQTHAIHKWYELQKRNKKDHNITGEICISMESVPEDEAIQFFENKKVEKERKRESKKNKPTEDTQEPFSDHHSDEVHNHVPPPRDVVPPPINGTDDNDVQFQRNENIAHSMGLTPQQTPPPLEQTDDSHVHVQYIMQANMPPPPEPPKKVVPKTTQGPPPNPPELTHFPSKTTGPPPPPPGSENH